jgi:acyl carrier protein
MPPEHRPGNEAEAIEARLSEFIQGELLGPGARIDRRDDLLSGELLDSVAVLRLAAFVEEELGVPMQPADFVVENFQNVAVLGEYVRRSRGPAG